MSIANPVIDFIDGDARLIYLRSGVTAWHPIDDIYVEVRRLRATDPSLRRYFPFCEALELFDKGGGKFTGRALILLQGTLIVPFDEDTTQSVTGELLDGQGAEGVDLIDTSGASNTVKINYTPPPAAEYILTFSKETEDQSYTDSRVWIDIDNGESGQFYPVGVPGRPVNNLADAQAIIADRNLPKRLRLRGTLNLQPSESLENYDVEGDSVILSALDVATGANTSNMVIRKLTLTGDLSGNVTAEAASSLTQIIDFEGAMQNCGLNGVLNVADNSSVTLDSCYSEVPGSGSPMIVMGANSQLIMRNYSGGITVCNMTDGCTASVDLDPGTLNLDNTNIGGELRVRGTGVVNDDSAGANILKDSLIKADELDLLFYDRKVAFDSVRGTSGETEFPVGSLRQPTSSESDARIIADKINVRKYQILGVMDLEEAHLDWEFNGNGGSTARVNIEGQDVSGSKFQSLNVQGAMVAETAIVEVRNGPFGNISGLRGTVVECGVFGTIGFGTAPRMNRFVRCQQGNSAPTFDCTNIAASGGIIFALWDGGMTITNLTQGTIIIDALGADITIDPSCTGGTIIIRGAYVLADNSDAGCTVERYGNLGDIEREEITRLINLAEADEELTATTAILRKRGTSEVLLEKTVTGGVITPVALNDV